MKLHFKFQQIWGIYANAWCIHMFCLTVTSGQCRPSRFTLNPTDLIGKHACRYGADGHVIVVLQRPLLASHLRDAGPAVSARSSAQRTRLSGDCPGPALVRLHVSDDPANPGQTLSSCPMHLIRSCEVAVLRIVWLTWKSEASESG